MELFLAKSKAGHFFLALEYHGNMRSILFCKGFRTFFLHLSTQVATEFVVSLLSPDTTDCPWVLVKSTLNLYLYFKSLAFVIRYLVNDFITTDVKLSI